MSEGLAQDLARALYGTADPPPPRLSLRGGPLTAELVDGGIRRLAWNGVELVRGIAFLIRDEAWGTLPLRLGPPHVMQDDTRFSVTLQGAIAAEGAAAFQFTARIEGDATGHFSVTVEGRPGADMVVNRAGFVILHPAHFGGLPVTLITVDGREIDDRFPEIISPGQPFFDLKGLRYALPGAGTVTCLMHARLPNDPLGRFETEDQRNWCDASFKTYVGSLLHPHPYRLAAGETFAQTVSVSIVQDGVRPAPSLAPCAPAPPARLPAFGLGVPHRGEALDRRAAETIRALRLPWLLVEADMRRDDLEAHLVAVAQVAAGRKVRLDVIVPATAEPAQELAAAARACTGAGLHVDAVLAVPAPYLKSYQPTAIWPDLPPLADWYAAAPAAFPAAEVGGGMVTNFTELNRMRPDPAGLAFVAHATTAIVHDADDVAVMETLETLAHIGRSVRALWPGVLWQLGPSSIAMRSNPYGSSQPQNPQWQRMPLADRDPRQRGLFAAAWTVGYAEAAARSGAALVGLHESHGHLGLVDEDGLRPCYHVMVALAEASGRPLVRLDGPPGTAALAWDTGEGRRALVANLGADPVPMMIGGGGLVLNSVSAAEARGDKDWTRREPAALPGHLGPFAVAFLVL